MVPSSQHPLLVPLLLADLLRSECTRTQSLHPPPSTLLPAHTPNDLRDISTGVSHRRHSLRTPRLTPDYTMAAWLAFHPILPLTLAKTWQASLNLYFLPHPYLIHHQIILGLLQNISKSCHSFLCLLLPHASPLTSP